MSRLRRLAESMPAQRASNGGVARRLADSELAQRAFRSGLARRLAPRLLAAQRAPEDLVTPYAAWAELEKHGVEPLVPSAREDIAFVVPEFRRGSGGHTTIANLVRGLEKRGRMCSIWIDDPLGRTGGAAQFRALFGPFSATVHDDLRGFDGAGCAVATGWQTVAPVLRLAHCGARVHLVQDDEPEFYPSSAERMWAEQAYRLPTITAGTWLAERMRARRLQATPFDLGIDHAIYRPQPVARTPNRVLFYARAVTPRRAVPLGMLALADLHARRPDIEIVLFGDATPLAAPFPFTNLGILEAPGVARAYAQAAVGVVLSLTNHSLAAQEMAATGLPTVELRTPSTEAAFGDSPIELAPATVAGLAAAIEHLLDDPGDRGPRGIEWAKSRTWDAAAAAFEAGL
jgi:glycosyltransferase involved in cell wall biosynthesis